MIYKNYTITENPEEGHRFIGFPTEQGADHDVNFEGDGPSSNCIYGDSVEDIKNEIEAMSNTSETTYITKLRNEILALQISVMVLNDEVTIYVLSRMIKEKEDQLKDLQFDQETNPLPFPQK